MDLIAYAVPFFLLAIGVEITFGIAVGRNTYRVNDSFSSLMLGILSQARKFVVLGIGGLVYEQVTQWRALSLWPADSVVTWLVAFVLYDFCYYWLHRIGHERQILWAAHVAHHQSEEYNLSTALRQTSTGFLLGWVFYVPMYALGVPAEVVVSVGALNLIYQFWVHTRHVPELGWLEYCFVTPSNHRVHHAQNSCYMDRNYGGVFIIWDRLFGTYQREIPNVPCVYGIRGAIHSWNPIVALTHVYLDMARDFYRSESWSERLAVLTARTGWQPASVRNSTPRHKASLQDFEVYNPKVSPLVQLYAVLQLIAATGCLAFGQFTSLSSTGYWLWWLLLVWSGVATALWLEKKSPVLCVVLDVPRLVLLAGLALASPDLTGPWQVATAVWSGLSLLCVMLMWPGVGDIQRELGGSGERVDEGT